MVVIIGKQVWVVSVVAVEVASVIEVRVESLLLDVLNHFILSV
jgi:hypothetical protein